MLSMMSVTSQARSIRASASWVFSIATEYAASSASPSGHDQPDADRQRAATSTSSTPLGTNTTVLSSR